MTQRVAAEVYLEKEDSKREDVAFGSVVGLVVDLGGHVERSAVIALHDLVLMGNSSTEPEVSQLEYVSTLTVSMQQHIVTLDVPVDKLLILEVGHHVFIPFGELAEYV